LVEITNALSLTLGRPLNWVHMPVAPDRADPDFYAALGRLRTPPETELYLGLLYPEDGLEGARRRVEAAHRFTDGFGIATECGWGRRPPAILRELLEMHRQLSRPVTARRVKRARPFTWPKGFQRVPGEDWVQQPVDTFGASYDKVDAHGWYRNLDPTVEQLAAELKEGQVLVDYSGGTGILLDRLRLRIFDREVGMLIADSSPKFLRVALERFHDDPRVALRLLRYLKEEKRLQGLDEVLGAGLRGKVDVLACTNAIHLYTDLPAALASWRRALKPAGRIFVNSGNIRNPDAQPGEWILDETVYVVHELATGLVRTDPRYRAYREVLDDPGRLKRHLEFRDRVFVAPRPLEYYTAELEKAGFRVDEVDHATITADVDEWYEFLKTYHDAVLGWVGGSVKVEGEPAGEHAVEDRLALIREAMRVIFGGRKTFRCCWTYISGTAAG
jgi:ubiquinone/menaquinone biosynthesis C-methylase UbiE